MHPTDTKSAAWFVDAAATQCQDRLHLTRANSEVGSARCFGMWLGVSEAVLCECVPSRERARCDELWLKEGTRDYSIQIYNAVGVRVLSLTQGRERAANDMLKCVVGVARLIGGD
jgi:hypothetical protein